MLRENAYTVTDIEKSGERLRDRRPYIKELISFYETLFLIQKQHRSKLSTIHPSLDLDGVNEKIEHGFPLLSKADFTVDMETAATLFEKVTDLCSRAEAGLKNSAAALTSYMQNSGTEFGTLARNYLDGALMHTEDDIGKEHMENVAFMVYNSLKPSVINFSEALADKYLNSTVHKEMRICPVCGEQPAFSVLSGNGGRSLVCSFCWHEWPVIRIFCPYCDNKESDSLSYIYIENEKEVRADLCGKCMKYIKSVDLRELDDNAYPPLEIVSSVTLDIKAAEER